MKLTVLFMTLAASFSLSSCMMMALGHGAHGSSHDLHDIDAGAASAHATVRLRVEISPHGKESTILVDVLDRNNQSPISGAQVNIKVIEMHQNNPASHTHEAATSVQGVTESSSRGVYVLKHRFDQAGHYKVEAVVLPAVSDPVTVSAMVHIASPPHAGGHSTTWMIAGGAAMMAVMMVFMWR